MCQEADAHRRVDVQDVLELLADADLHTPGAMISTGSQGWVETIQITLTAFVCMLGPFSRHTDKNVLATSSTQLKASKR